MDNKIFKLDKLSFNKQTGLMEITTIAYSLSISQLKLKVISIEPNDSKPKWIDNQTIIDENFYSIKQITLI